MKRLLLISASLAALGTAPALAADLAPRAYSKAPVPAPVVTWGGFYVGVEAGAASTRDAWSFDGVPFGNPDGNGAFGGGVIGYNWQLPNNVVLGFEGNFDAADIKGTSTCTFLIVASGSCESKLDSLYSATGRLGYAASGPLGPMLFFAKAGVAWTDQKLSFAGDTLLGPETLSGSARRTGWTVGTGLEYMFAPNWSAKLEYDYYDFGNKTTTLTDQFGDTGDISSKLTVNTVKAGVNYHFGDPSGPKF
jgi:outer membrane immunogenic protein